MLVLITIASAKNCFLLKDQECSVKKIMINDDYMTFPYNIKVDRCTGNCNNITNPYSRVCLPDITKNVTVRVFNLISQQNEMKEISFHKSCKCDCLLNETVCNNKQKWNSEECKCECLKIERFEEGFVWNVSSSEYEQGKKALKLITEEDCKEINDETIQNKTISITKYVDNCKPLVASSILFV